MEIKSGQEIKLTGEKLERNRDFLKFIYGAELEGVNKGFSKLILGDKREPDPNMTLDTFLDNFNSEIDVIVDIGSWLPDVMGYRASGKLFGDQIVRQAWVTCKLNDSNYAKMDHIFTNTYGCDLVAIRSAQGIKALGITVGSTTGPGAIDVVSLKGYDEITPNIILRLVINYFSKRFEDEIGYIDIPEGRINGMTTNGIIHRGPVIYEPRGIKLEPIFGVDSTEIKGEKMKYHPHNVYLYSARPHDHPREKETIQALIEFKECMKREKRV